MYFLNNFDYSKKKLAIRKPCNIRLKNAFESMLTPSIFNRGTILTQAGQVDVYLHVKSKRENKSIVAFRKEFGTYRVLIKYCGFFQLFLKVCHLSLVSTWLLLVEQKLPANRSDCTLALRWELWRPLTAM